MEPIATVTNLTVTYGPRHALSNVSLAMPSGATGLLGPNGAGKTTLIRALLGFIPPLNGRIDVLGIDVLRDPLDVRGRVAYVSEQDAYIPGFDALSSVAYCGELAGLPSGDALERAHDVISYVGLGDVRYRDAATYSTGLRQRLKLAQALVQDPDFLILDEPTNGMDSRGRDEMLALIAALVRQHHINVLFSSHLLPDIERVCDYIIIMRQGTVVASGRLSDLRTQERRIYEVRIKGDKSMFVAAVRARGIGCDTGDDGHIVVDLSDRDSHVLFAAAASCGAEVRHLKAQLPTLEDLFVKLADDSAGPGG